MSSYFLSRDEPGLRIFASRPEIEKGHLIITRILRRQHQLQRALFSFGSLLLVLRALRFLRVLRSFSTCYFELPVALVFCWFFGFCYFFFSSTAPRLIGSTLVSRLTWTAEFSRLIFNRLEDGHSTGFCEKRQKSFASFNFRPSSLLFVRISTPPPPPSPSSSTSGASSIQLCVFTSPHLAIDQSATMASLGVRSQMAEESGSERIRLGSRAFSSAPGARHR